MSSDEQLVQLIEHYQKALLINPHSDLIYHQLAELYYQQGDLEKTLKNCQRALQIKPDSEPASKTLSKVFIRLGFITEEVQGISRFFSNTSTLEEAFMAFGKIIEPLEDLNEKNDSETWKKSVILGCEFIKQKLWEEAFSSYFRAIELEPSLNFPHLIIQYLLLPEISDLDSVAELYFQAIQFSRVHCLAYTVLGDILTKQNKLFEAVQAYKSAWLGAEYQIYTKEHVVQQRTSVDYLIIGIGKAGTSSLSHYLSQHPGIINPHKKEVLFFNKYFELGLDWYLAQFPPYSLKEKKFLTGEATPWYLGTIGVENRVFQAFPDVKLIAILRDPGARAISHYYMNLKMGLEQRSLEEAIADEIAVLGDAVSLTQVSETYWKTERGYLWFSLYLPFLKKWMFLFPREQFLILNSEDLYNAPSKTLSRVFEFLNISDCELISYPKLNLGSYSQVDHDLRKLLFDYFYVHNQKLEEYLGMEFGWNNTL